MEADAREFGLFIDGLRLDRNMSRDDLCEGIISLSQYKRYLRGDTSIPNNILVLIADRLKFSISELHLLYRHRTDIQHNSILEIYSLIRIQKYQEAYNIASKMKDEIIVSDYNKLFFDFCLINIQYHLKLVSEIHVLGLYSRLIDYPECVKNDSFNWVELNTLLQIVLISAKMDNYEPSQMMFSLLTSPTFQFAASDNFNYMPTIYSNLSQILGIQEKYHQVIETTNSGINYCRKHETFSSLSMLYLMNSFAYFDLDLVEEAMVSAKKAFIQLFIEDKPDKFNRFKISFENKFEIKLEELIVL